MARKKVTVETIMKAKTYQELLDMEPNEIPDNLVDLREAKMNYLGIKENPERNLFFAVPRDPSIRQKEIEKRLEPYKTRVDELYNIYMEMESQMESAVKKEEVTAETIMKATTYQELLDMEPDDIPDSLVDLREAKMHYLGIKENPDINLFFFPISGSKRQEEIERRLEPYKTKVDELYTLYLEMEGQVESVVKEEEENLIRTAESKQVEQGYEPYVSKAEKLNHVAKQYTEEQRKEKIAAVQSMKEIIERLEKTLSGELTAGDVAAFEKQLPKWKNALENLTGTVGELFAQADN